MERERERERERGGKTKEKLQTRIQVISTSQWLLPKKLHFLSHM
jgi:hypothetical protein